MPVNDPVNFDPGLNRTMCPHCGEDTHFVVPAVWNIRSYDDWQENRYQKFVRHSQSDDGSGHDARDRKLKLDLQDDTQIQCGACKNAFAYADGRQAFVDQEQGWIESSVVPSSTPLPEPTLFPAGDGYNNSWLTVPVAAYDFIHEGGIGNRGIAAYTSVISLSTSLDAGGDSRWFIDMPDIESAQHRPSTPSEVRIGKIGKVPMPISIPPEHLMALVRNLYQHHAYAESYKRPEDDIAYAKQERSNSRPSGVTISMDEANQIVKILKDLNEIGSHAQARKELMSSSSFPFHIVANLSGKYVMQVPTKPGRILKSIAREVGVEIVNVEIDSWNWEIEARAFPDVLNFHGAVPYYNSR